jgi:hypothetical protein
MNFRKKLEGWLNDDAPYYAEYYDVDWKYFERKISAIIEVAAMTLESFINQALKYGELEYEDNN